MLTCIAQSTHTVEVDNAEGAQSFEWSIEGKAYFVSGEGTATVVVGSDEGLFTSFILTCIVTDDNGNSVFSKTFIHKRVEGTPSLSEDTFYIMNESLTVENKTHDFITTDPKEDGTFKDMNDLAKIPTALEYPEDCTAVLINGDYIEVAHEFPSNEEWMFIRCYDIDGGNFKIMVIVYHGNNVADFMFGDQDNPPVLLAGYLNVSYTPMSGNYRIEGFVDLPSKKVIYDMSQQIEFKVIYDMTTQV